MSFNYPSLEIVLEILEFSCLNFNTCYCTKKYSKNYSCKYCILLKRYLVVLLNSYSWNPFKKDHKTICYEFIPSGHRYRREGGDVRAKLMDKIA